MNLLIIEEVFSKGSYRFNYETENLLNKQREFIKNLEKDKQTKYEKTLYNLNKNIKLYSHQQQGINFMLSQKACGLFDEQGFPVDLSA